MILEKEKYKNIWGQYLCIDFLKEIDPFADLKYFRPLDMAYTGDNTFWTIPSPEPDLDSEFWDFLKSNLYDEKIRKIALNLATQISDWESDGNKLVFAAILRAGAPVADWLCRLMPGSEAASLSLFVGLGIDKVAVRALERKFPHRKIVFVDGWTGRGGVAKTIKKFGNYPLAVLIDPWGWADFTGCKDDVFCPTACFTGASTLGFSRTFFVDESSLFAAYRFPEKYCRYDLVETWQKACPDFSEKKEKIDGPVRFFRETALRIHANEVCRALINADPLTIFFLDTKEYVKENFSLLLALAKRRKIKIEYNAGFLSDYLTKVACSLNIAGR